MGRTFRDHVLAVAAEQGPEHLGRAQAWMDELPAVVERWRRHWQLGPLTEMPGSIHWVGAGLRADGQACVLKLAVPGAPQPQAEVQWLRRVAQAGSTAGGRVRAVRLLDADPAAGAQLLERVRPGRPLAADLLEVAGTSAFAAADDAACDVIGAAARAVRRRATTAQDDDDAGAGGPGGSALASLRGNLAELFAVAEQRDPRHRLLPGALVAAAAGQAHHLLSTAAAHGQADALLHGDLHHENVLRDSTPGRSEGSASGSGGWVVIDPHGVVGEPAYDVACSVYNPFQLGEVAVQRAVVRCERLAQAAQLPPDRVRGWALVQAVLSVVWSLSGAEEATPDVQHCLDVAERLAG